MMKRKDILKLLDQKPWLLFFLDANGALITSVFISLFILFKVPVGFSESVLTLLACFALILFFISLGSGILVRRKWKNFLRLVIGGNLVYTLLTAILMIIHANDLTVLGFIYFTVEIILILFLVYLELKLLQLSTS